jgi:hypothetical protein
MLFNPYTEPHRAVPYDGTRLLRETFGIYNAQVFDPKDAGRHWAVQSVYAPIRGRAIGGIRAKLVDTKGFITFCNQRDLEVLLGLATPGRWCLWLGEQYVHPEDREWCGLCADDDDLLDDLQERELFLRKSAAHGILSPPMEFVRRIHLDPNNDFEELQILLCDYDQETGYHPDPRLETIERRWARSHRDRVRWDRI